MLSNGGGRGCCRCICYCLFLLFFIIFIQITAVFYFYHVYDPKIPNYKLERINVKTLNVSPDSGLTVDLQVAVRAENPNKNIVFIYGNDGAVSIEYSGVNICAGELPAFDQSPGNTTIFEVELKGTSAFRPELLDVFMEQQSSRRIPVMVKLKVAVGVVVGEIRLRELNVSVNLTLVLDGLSPDMAAGIVSTEAVFRIEIL